MCGCAATTMFVRDNFCVHILLDRWLPPERERVLGKGCVVEVHRGPGVSRPPRPLRKQAIVHNIVGDEVNVNPRRQMAADEGNERRRCGAWGRQLVHAYDECRERRRHARKYGIIFRSLPAVGVVLAKSHKEHPERRARGGDPCKERWHRVHRLIARIYIHILHLRKKNGRDFPRNTKSLSVEPRKLRESTSRLTVEVCEPLDYGSRLATCGHKTVLSVEFAGVGLQKKSGRQLVYLEATQLRKVPKERVGVPAIQKALRVFAIGPTIKLEVEASSAEQGPQRSLVLRVALGRVSTIHVQVDFL